MAAPAMATLELLLTTTNAAGATIGTTTLLTPVAATGLFAVVGIAKAVGLGLLLSEAARNKRSVDAGPKSLGIESSFSIVSQLEPAQCMKRLICDVASGKMASDETDEVILAPFQVILKDFFCKPNFIDFMMIRKKLYKTAKLFNDQSIDNFDINERQPRGKLPRKLEFASRL